MIINKIILTQVIKINKSQVQLNLKKIINM